MRLFVLKENGVDYIATYAGLKIGDDFSPIVNKALETCEKNRNAPTLKEIDAAMKAEFNCELADFLRTSDSEFHDDNLKSLVFCASEGEKRKWNENDEFVLVSKETPGRKF